MKKPWIAIVWFTSWGLFQTYAVAAVLRGTWQRPEAFPQEAYEALIYPDLLFIPLYFLAAFFLLTGHWPGPVLGLVCGGAVIYVMIYLLALAKFQGTINLTWDVVFLIVNAISVLQLVAGIRNRKQHRTGC